MTESSAVSDRAMLRPATYRAPPPCHFSTSEYCTPFLSRPVPYLNHHSTITITGRVPLAPRRRGAGGPMGTRETSNTVGSSELPRAPASSGGGRAKRSASRGCNWDVLSQSEITPWNVPGFVRTQHLHGKSDEPERYICRCRTNTPEDVTGLHFKVCYKVSQFHVTLITIDQTVSHLLT